MFEQTYLENELITADQQHQFNRVDGADSQEQVVDHTQDEYEPEDTHRTQSDHQSQSDESEMQSQVQQTNEKVTLQEDESLLVD